MIIFKNVQNLKGSSENRTYTGPFSNIFSDYYLSEFDMLLWKKLCWIVLPGPGVVGSFSL